MVATPDIQIILSVDALKGKFIHVIAVEGFERISDLYRYEIEFIGDDPIDASIILGQSATLTIKLGGDSQYPNNLYVHGIVTEFSSGDVPAGGSYAYHAVLSPQLGLLDLNRRSLVYAPTVEIDPQHLIQSVLSSQTFSRSFTLEPRIRLEYDSRKQIVQYAESDLAFIRRQCEHEGIFFFFEQNDANETLVFGDRNDACGNISIGPDKINVIPFKNMRNAARATDLALTRFRAIWRQMPNSITLKDYNENSGSPALSVSKVAVQGAAGYGDVVEYGDHFASDSQGRRLAGIRSEELACRGKLYVGESNVPQLRAGTVFKLAGNPLEADAVQYLVVSVRHSVSVPVPASLTAHWAFHLPHFGRDTRSPKPYTNVIECIPYTTPFRPERKTPRPRIPGLVTATIDAEDANKGRGWMDINGRYKVRFDFDDGNSAAGAASDFVRQSQPYLGPNTSGMHFPLVKDTEVVVSYLNGDPDRPIVVGAVANAARPDLVTSANNTVNCIETAANVRLEIDDRMAQTPDTSPQTPFFRVDVPAQVGGRSFTGTYLRFGQAVSSDETALVPKADGSAASGGTPQDGVLLYTNKALAVNVAGTATHTYGTGYSTTTTSGSSTHIVKNGGYSLDVHGDIELTSYGNIAVSAKKSEDDNNLNGNLTQTIDGKYTLTVSGDLKKVSSANHDIYNYGDYTTHTYGDYETHTQGNYTITNQGIYRTIKLSLDLSLNIGLNAKMCVGGELKIAIIQDSKFFLGANITVGLGTDMKFVVGSNVQSMSRAFKYVKQSDIKQCMADIKYADIEYKRLQSAAVTDLSAAYIEKKASVESGQYALDRYLGKNFVGKALSFSSNIMCMA